MEKLISPTRYYDSPGLTGRRAAIFLTIVLLHASIFIFLVLSGHASEQNQTLGASSVVTLTASNTPLVVPPPLPTVLADSAVKISIAVEAESGGQSEEGDPDGEVCSPLDEVASQLASDPLVSLAIKRVAKADRSVSEAIVVWNTEWSAASANEAPLAQVRERVISILESLPTDCLAAPVTGPRLIAISEEGYTTFLAFGSGQWSWQQLVDSNPNNDLVEPNSWAWEALLPEVDKLDIF